MASGCVKQPQLLWYHSYKYSAQAAREHCEGIIRHEPWCVRVDPIVCYAYQIVADSGRLTPGDALALHALGVKWKAEGCPEIARKMDSCGETENFLV